MKFIASVVLLAAIQVLTGKKWWRGGRFVNLGRRQDNVAVINQLSCAESNAVAINAGIGNANANSVSVADNNNCLYQRNQ